MNHTKSKKRILVAGAYGQLGWELARTVDTNIDLYEVDLDNLDISKRDQVQQKVAELRPDWIINAAAYTAVDKAEQNSALAYKVNRDGARNLAQAAKEGGARLIHVSTDFVFDGKKSSPYLPDDKVNPLCVYGASKQAGDEAVLSISDEHAIVLRTAWVYSSHGNNFVKTMLKLMRQREELGIVADQVGTPTWANGLAKAIWKMIELDLVPVTLDDDANAIHDSRTTNDESRIYHWTDAGVASWYDFAIAIQEEAQTLGLLKKVPQCRIKPIRTEDYPTPAKRPANSQLDKTNTWQALATQPQHWRKALRTMLTEVDIHSD